MPAEFSNVRRIQPQTLSRTADFAKRTLMKPIPVKLIPEPRINSQFRLIIDQRIGVRSQQAVRKILNLDLSPHCASQTNRRSHGHHRHGLHEGSLRGKPEPRDAATHRAGAYTDS